jgi:opine dehydrogenase
MKWAVIGGGNGGQSAAAHLGVLGFQVTLFDVMPDTVNAINFQGGIYVDGAVKGFGKVEKATTDISEAMEGADIIMVILPALYHRSIAKNLAPHLKDGQIVFIHPGATFGAFEFKQVFEEEQCQADVVIAEAQSLLYACRLNKPGFASIKGIKKNLMVAAIPASKTQEVIHKLNTAFPEIIPGKNVLDTSLNNLNAIMHPGPTLFNVSMIESPYDWRYYWDGITPSIGAFIEHMDQERVDLGELLGLELPPVLEQYKILYEVEGETLSEAVKMNKAYEEVMGQKRVDTRYMLEDIPMSLYPLVSMAKQLGCRCEMMEGIVNLGCFVLDQDLKAMGRSMKSLGFENMTIDDIKYYAETGIKRQSILSMDQTV